MPSKPGRHAKVADGDPGEWRTNRASTVDGDWVGTQAHSY